MFDAGPPSMPSGTDDPDIADIALAADGDRVAFARIVRRNLSAITALAERLLGSHTEAEDVAQDVFLQAWKQTRGWRGGEAKFSTWLYRVALSRCTDRLRRRRESPLDALPEQGEIDATLDVHLQQQAVAQRLRHALLGLPERQRAAVVLCHYQELSNIEAAATLEISVDALESLLARGRRALRSALLAERHDLSGDLT